MSQNRQLLITLAILAAIIFAASGRAYAEDAAKVIELPGDSAYPESIAASPDGTLYVSSLASGGIIRIQPGAANAEVWIRVSILGDLAVIETIKAGLAGPTSAVKVGETAWVTEGQLPHLFDPAANGPPRLPFRIIGVPLGP
jgi:streptogramin lyase